MIWLHTKRATMNYIGSKYKLSSWIKSTILNVVGDVKDKIFCDIFAGTGIIGRTFKKDVKKIIANDIEYYSYILNKNYIQNHKPLSRANDLIKELNSLPPKEGFIYKNYCLGSGSNRQYFSDNNGKKIVKKLYSLISKKPNKFLARDQLKENKTRAISDFISGMTDRYAINLYNSTK